MRRNQQRNSPTAKALQELGELMNRQQQLMDETFRMPQQGQQGDSNQQPGEDGAEPGARGQAQGLADQQAQLEDMLNSLMDSLRNRGMTPHQGLGDAQGEMQGAEGSLRQGDKGTALGQQGRALQNLRDGAQSMAQEMMRQGTGNQGAMGNHENSGQEGEDFDPLGRPGPTSGETLGRRKNVVPNEIIIRRAQEILRDLRNRLSNPSRPQIERDYLERLMREIY